MIDQSKKKKEKKLTSDLQLDVKAVLSLAEHVTAPVPAIVSVRHVWEDQSCVAEFGCFRADRNVVVSFLHCPGDVLRS